MKISHMSIAALGLFAFVSGCATLNEDQCQVADWRQLGVEDGNRGYPSTYVAEHQKACSKYSIPVDASLWQAGWQEGIRSHCTPGNGIETGRRGGSNYNSCPADLAGGFNDAYRVGRDVYEARIARDRIQNELDADIRALAKADEKALPALRVEIELKRNRLFMAQNRLSDAERAADLYRLRTGLR